MAVSFLLALSKRLPSLVIVRAIHCHLQSPLFLTFRWQHPLHPQRTAKSPPLPHHDIPTPRMRCRRPRRHSLWNPHRSYIPALHPRASACRPPYHHLLQVRRLLDTIQYKFPPHLIFFVIWWRRKREVFFIGLVGIEAEVAVGAMVSTSTVLVVTLSVSGLSSISDTSWCSSDVFCTCSNQDSWHEGDFGVGFICSGRYLQCSIRNFILDHTEVVIIDRCRDTSY